MHTYIVYNKPKGIICTTEKIEGNIIDALGINADLLPVGRLDKDSEGLILLTDNTAIINKIIHPDFKHEKEYVVTLNLPLRNQFLKQMAEGINLGNEITKPCVITAEPGTKRIFRIILKQGLNRQIRRMCAVFKYQVIKLQRVRIMHIKLENMAVGEWRNLTEEELTELFLQLS
jgi:23S rRNA pseudouridine2604 synthase